MQRQRHKRRKDIATLRQQLLHKHPQATVTVVSDNATTHQDNQVEAVVCAAAGKLIRLYLPTDSPWLNPIERLWWRYRRKVTHCELFENIQALVQATFDFFRRYNTIPSKVLSIIGFKPASVIGLHLEQIPT